MSVEILEKWQLEDMTKGALIERYVKDVIAVAKTKDDCEASYEDGYQDGRGEVADEAYERAVRERRICGRCKLCPDHS
jgi:hypothetical protein